MAGHGNICMEGPRSCSVTIFELHSVRTRGETLEMHYEVQWLLVDPVLMENTANFARG